MNTVHKNPTRIKEKRGEKQVIVNPQEKCTGLNKLLKQVCLLNKQQS